MLFPKLLGLAERAWSTALVNNEDTMEDCTRKLKTKWNVFANLLGQRELPRLAVNGITYRIPPVGFIISKEKIICKTTFPGTRIFIKKKDGTIFQYQAPVSIKNLQLVYAEDVLGRKSEIRTIQ